MTIECDGIKVLFIDLLKLFIDYDVNGNKNCLLLSYLTRQWGSRRPPSSCPRSNQSLYWKVHQRNAGLVWGGGVSNPSIKRRYKGGIPVGVPHGPKKRPNFSINPR